MPLKPLILTRLALCAIVLAISLFVPQRLQPTWIAVAAPEVAQRFQSYYNEHEGLRVLGNPVGGEVFAYTYPAQYFEKGRIEDHRGESDNPAWAFTYGLLVPELMEGSPDDSVSTTSITYANLSAAHDPGRRTVVGGSRTGVIKMVNGTFVPFDAGLGSAPGYVVPDYFWDYINRADLFPGGWLHDVGLPMTQVMSATVEKNGETRAIMLQAFERAVLTYDAKNPADFQVERGNIGADAVQITDQLAGVTDAAIQMPAPSAVTTLPLHIVARFKGDDTQIEAELRWEDGTVFTNTLQVLREDGDPIVVDSINWLIESQPPRPASPEAMLTLRHELGEVIARQNVSVLYFDSPDSQQVKLYFLDDDQQLQETRRAIPKTPAPATAALQELLWGIDPSSLAGFGTALPSPEKVLNFTGREPTWGPRVTLRGLIIKDGVATADFSEEINAYGGGSARVQAIRDQITATLKQFSTVRDVRIEVGGRSEGVLQP